MSERTDGHRCVEAFREWHASWWKNEPNAIMRSNAQEAFFAGWDAAKQAETRSGKAFGFDVDEIARVLAGHVLSKPNGGTASMSWCDCSCGEQSRIDGGTRDLAEAMARKHQAHAVAVKLWRHREHRSDGNECIECVFRQGAFMDGAAWCAARIPSEREIVRAMIDVSPDTCWEYLSAEELAWYMRDARAVLKLIEEKITG